MEDNRYIATPHRNGTWTVVETATGEDVEASGIAMLFLTEELAEILAEMLNTNPQSQDHPTSVVYGNFQSNKH